MGAPRVLLAGGGHSHVEVLRRRASETDAGIEATLVSPGALTPYSGMLPGLVAGHYTVEETHIALAPLAEAAATRFVRDRVVALDLRARSARLASGGVLAFDVLSLDVGSSPSSAMAGAQTHAVGVKPVDRFLEAWAETREAAREGRVRNVAVVGGGAGGIEILLAMQARLVSELGAVAPAFALVTDLPHLLPRHAGAVRRRVGRLLAERRIVLHVNAKVDAVGPGEVLVRDGRRIVADRIFLATSAAAAPWLAQSGLACDAGFVAVNDHLQSTSHPFVFAAGDCASQVGRDYPKSGLYAVRQGPVLAENLRRFTKDEPLSAFRPQRRALALLATGERRAILSWDRFAAEGAWVWRWKDRIDRTFMERYRLPASADRGRDLDATD
jgi:selenide,water dikinase